jgi:Icc-related predicted phosphoesterase
MIILIGDLHGEFGYLPNILKDVPNDATLIQVGDFGVYRELKDQWERMIDQLDRFEKPIYFIDGNHEELPLFYDPDVIEPQKVWKNLIWIPRGTVMEIDGYRIGFMGGAASPDRVLRTEGLSWWPQEAISYGEFERMLQQEGPIDLLITHTPPDSVVRRHFRHPSILFSSWRLPSDWKDWSAIAVEKIWNHFGQPALVCGHFHKTIQDGNVRILDINEVLEWNG